MVRQNRIDLNSDVGESFGIYKLGLDEEVIPLNQFGQYRMRRSCEYLCNRRFCDPRSRRDMTSRFKAFCLFALG